MRHFASPAFWEAYEKLPAAVRDLADKNYSLMKQDQHHPSLRLKEGRALLVCACRVGHRALAVDVDGGLLWFWIGSHADYDAMIG